MIGGAYLRKIVADIRATYWFIPGCLVIGAVALSIITEYFDQNPGLLPFTLPPGLSDTQADGARALLSTIGSGLIGVTGVMFSMTIVAVSFATGNLGPRLIGNFMRDRGNQWSLGILIATYVYALLTLRSIQAPGDGDITLFVPHLSVLVALILAGLSVATMIYFVHHIPETINVSRITASLGRQFCEEIRKTIEHEQDADTEATWPDDWDWTDVRVRQTGYIQTVDTKKLMKMADKFDWFIDVRRPPGDFITPTYTVLRIHHQGEIGDDVRDDLQSVFATGDARTDAQNTSFVAQQLVEMIARAMSPGVNDPYTAINCYNWLYAGLEVAKTHKGGLKGARRGRIDGLVSDYERLWQVSFEESWPYAKTDEMVAAHWKKLNGYLNALDADRIDAVEPQQMMHRSPSE